MSDEVTKLIADLAKADRSLADAETKIRDLQKALNDKEVALALRDKDLAVLRADLDREVAKHADPEEEILKGMNDAARKLFLAQKANAERLEKRLAEEDEKRAVADVAKMIQTEYSGLPVKAEDLAPVLKKVMAATDSEQMDVLNKALKAGSEALKVLAKAQGTLRGGVAKTSTEAKVEKQARELAASQNISFEKAYQRVLDADPSLYTAMREESAASIQ